MTENKEKVSVLFVCMGNICRSPTAEGVFRHFVNEAGLADRFHIDSAGTHAYHIDNPPDRRSQAAAERRGYSLTEIRARRVQADDFLSFDYVVAMDRDNERLLREQAEEGLRERIVLFLPFADAQLDEVPDPYYGGAAGFERVLDLVEEAAKAMLGTLRSRHDL